MQIQILAQLVALMSVVSAAPKPENTPLAWDDVILVGNDGTHKLVKHSEYQQLAARGILQPAPAAATSDIKQRSSNDNNNNKKRCEKSAEVQITSDTEFVNWDVAMSPVVSSAGGGATVGVTSGYSLSNSLTVTAGMSATIEAVLSLSMSMSYSETWTTTEGSSISYTLPDNNFGLIVSQPMTRRVVGNYLDGCTDSPTITPFTSDTYSSQSYGNMEWVTGVIRLCNSTTYPVPYCIGTGTHS